MNYRWLFYEFSCWLQQLVCVGHSYLYGIYCSVGFSFSDFLIAFCFSNQSSACLAKECKENTTSLIETYSSAWSIRFEMMWFTRRKNDINRGSLFSFFCCWWCFFFVFLFCFMCVCVTRSSDRRLHICWGPILLDEWFRSLCLYYRKTTGINFMILSYIYLTHISRPAHIFAHLCTLNSCTLLLAPVGAVFCSVPPLALSWTAKWFPESRVPLCVVVCHSFLSAVVFCRCERRVCQVCCLTLLRLG